MGWVVRALSCAGPERVKKASGFVSMLKGCFFKAKMCVMLCLDH